jgi:phytoene dehydrogenase-like protein
MTPADDTAVPFVTRHTTGPADFERHNPSLVGGDLSGGEPTLRQLFFRPALQPVSYSTPLRRVFVCSSSTPPGGGVHELSVSMPLKLSCGNALPKPRGSGDPERRPIIHAA